MRQSLLALITLVLWMIPIPARAQETVSPWEWIPEAFSSVVRVDMDNATTTLDELDIAYYVASYIQPFRIVRDRPRTFDDFFPVEILDTENVTFETTILPWLAGDIVLAYRTFDEALGVDAGDVLLILPTDDPFRAASFLSPVVQAQDFPEHETYRDVSIFAGDQTAIAFTPTAVLVGSTEVLHDALDAHAGEAELLADDPVFTGVQEQLEDRGTVFAYLSGGEVMRALSVAVQGNASAEPLLSALGEALKAFPGGGLETALLNNEISGVGLTLEPDPVRQVVHASAVIATTAPNMAESQVPADSPAFDERVLNYVPRGAMIVQSGPQGRTAFYDVLAALPLTGFIGDVLGGFLPPQSGSTVQPVPPSGDDIEAAVSGLMTAMAVVREFDLDADLVDYLKGSYVVALIPRPNNPTPGAGVPYDMLFVVQADDPQAALDGVKTLISVILDVDPAAFTDETVDETTFSSLLPNASIDPLVQMGVVDNLLIVGTGSAVEQAMRARIGDNRLVNMDRWQAIAASSPNNAPPALYVDLNSLYNTFLPSPGGPVQQGIGQLGLDARALGDGLYRVDLVVTLPT